jgi:hypothetical protein
MIRIGAVGWSLASAFRPAFPAEGTQLARYARVLTGVEINSPSTARTDATCTSDGRAGRRADSGSP